MSLSPLRLACLALAAALPCLAHPVPDVPVRANFAKDGAWTVQVEIDPRCFEPDPNIALSVTNGDLATATFTPEKREQLKAQARDYIKKVVEIALEPAAPVEPAFTWEFTTHNNVPLKEKEDIVVLTGTWQTKLPEGSTGYFIKALPEGSLSVLPENTALGQKVERLQILFPGETSYVLDLKTYTPRTPPPPVISASADPVVPPVVPMADPAICTTCYEASTEQTLPVIIASVAIVLGMMWWKRKRLGKAGA